MSTEKSAPPSAGQNTMELPLAPEAPGDLLAGKTVLVTGAADGLGRAISLTAAACGAELVLLDKAVRKLERLYDDILAAGGREPAIYPLDLEGAQPNDYQDLAARLDDACGGLDALVHNAAHLGMVTPLEHCEPAEWFRVVQINLNAPFLLSKACLPLLRASGDGRLMFISDEVASSAKAYWGAYAASKAALEALCQVAAEELENEGKVFAFSVDPGPVATTMRANAYPAEDRERLRGPETIAPALVQLLGPQGRTLHARRIRLAR